QCGLSGRLPADPRGGFAGRDVESDVANDLGLPEKLLNLIEAESRGGHDTSARSRPALRWSHTRRNEAASRESQSPPRTKHAAATTQGITVFGWMGHPNRTRLLPCA